MIVAHPQFLWLFLLAGALAGMGWRAGNGGSRRWPVALLRGLCVAMLALALARPMVRTRSASWTRVVVVDLGPRSPVQIVHDATESLRATTGEQRVVAYSNRVELLPEPSLLKDAARVESLRARLSRPLASDDSKGGGSALASAIQLAAAQIPSDGRGEIEVLSNGLATRGDAEAEAYRQARRGIAVRVTPATVAVPADVAAVVRGVSARAAVACGQTVPVDVAIESAVTGTARVSLTGGGRPVSAAVRIEPGVRTVRLLLPLDTPGLATVVATVAVDGRPPSEPRSAAIDVGPPTRVLVVRQENDPSTAEALGRLLGRSGAVESVSPSELSARSLDGYGAVVLADVPADALTADVQQRLRQAVMDGTGLLVTGAARSFGPGGYDDSVLAPLLPVRMPQQAERVDPSTSLVLIIDTSGSMAEFGRIDLAKEIARLAISHLKPRDKVGIVEFYGGKRWAAPIQSAANVSVINRALNRLTAGGMTTLYPAVEEATFALHGVETQSKHVLILSDGGVETAAFEPLLRQMREDGTMVSTVAVAPTPGEPNMLPDLARWGGGRQYTVRDRFALPDITLKQPQVSLSSPMVRSPTPVIGTDDVLERAADAATWAPVDGYVRTVAKSTADVLLHTAGGDPLLVRWRYGAGYVAALPTQLGSVMTRRLQDEPGFSTLVSGLFRQLGGEGKSVLDVRPVVRPAGIEVDVTSPDVDPSTASAALRVILRDSHGLAVRSVAAEPVDTGRWNVLLPDVPAGSYAVEARMDGAPGAGRCGVAVVGPRDVPRLTADRELLGRVSGFGDMAARAAARLPNTTETFLDLRNALVVAAVLLMLLEVTARRWPESNSRRGRF